MGQEEPEEYEACGVSKADRGRRTDEAIRLMRRLWEEEDVTHEGEFYTCHNVDITPKPFFKPSPPVWIGGRSPSAARRVGRVGDGWLVSAATPEEIRSGREILFSTAEENKREIEYDHVGVMLGYYLSRDAEESVEKASRFVTRQRPDTFFTDYSALGSPEQVAECINTYAEAGAHKFVVRPLCPAEETMEQLELMGRGRIAPVSPVVSPVHRTHRGRLAVRPKTQVEGLTEANVRQRLPENSESSGWRWRHWGPGKCPYRGSLPEGTRLGSG